MPNDLPPFTYDSTDDGTGGLPAYLGQAMQFYGTDNSSPLPSYLSYPLNNQEGQPMFGGGAQVPQTPIAQAMQPPQPTNTPVSQAMAPSAPSTPLGQAMNPQLAAMLQHQAQDPNMSMSNGLIAAGSAMLGGKNLQDGMSAAGTAFNNSFDGTLNQQRDLNTPKVVPLADGAFSMVQMPGGQPQVMPNSQVQQFMLGKMQQQAQIAAGKVQLQANLKAQGQQEQDDRTNARENQTKLVTTDNAIAANQRALAAAQDQATNSPNMSRIAGALPGVAQTFGWDDAQGNLKIQRATVDGALVQDALKKGAITDQQAGFLNSDVPAPTADRATVVIPWLKQQGEILQKIRDFQASQVTKANPTPPQGFATSGTSNIGGGSQASPTGNGSYQPAAVTDAASYAALPSGTVFKAPDGTIRRKP